MTNSVLEATTEEVASATSTSPATVTAKLVKVFVPGGNSVDIPEVEDKTAAGYLGDAGITVGDCDVVYVDGRAVAPDHVVAVGDNATHVITASAEIACG